MDSYRKLSKDFTEASRYKPTPTSTVDLQKFDDRKAVPCFVGRVKSLEEVKEIIIKDCPRRIQKVILEDEHVTLVLTLWDKKVGILLVGDIVEIQNGWLREFQGKKELSVTRFSSVQVLLP